MAASSEYPGPDGRFPRAAAFTLLELLLVTAILAILAGFLVPALSRGKQHARAIVCLSNSRQLGIASHFYSMDHSGALPEFTGWLSAWSVTGSAGGSFPNGDLTTGQLYPYLKHDEVYLCPTDKLTLRVKSGKRTSASTNGTFVAGNLPARACSYAMNCILCHNNDTTRFVAPARTLLFMEADLPPDDLFGMVGPIVLQGVTSSFSSRHNGRGHLVFCDSHVERVTAAANTRLTRSKRFWLPAPTTDLISLGCTDLLPDP
jgi:prepilin-type N-terminal cleavage/methylation domain-containing protein/prepilin-type processing-associated H-X9-DG protein